MSDNSSREPRSARQMALITADAVQVKGLIVSPANYQTLHLHSICPLRSEQLLAAGEIEHHDQHQERNQRQKIR